MIKLGLNFMDTYATGLKVSRRTNIPYYRIKVLTYKSYSLVYTNTHKFNVLQNVIIELRTPLRGNMKVVVIVGINK